MYANKRLSLLIIGMMLLVSPAVFGGETPPPEPETDPDTGFMAYPLKFYRNTISRADGHRCPMHPSCSEYSAQAFRKHGFIIGWIMTKDRLLRCGRDEVRLSEEVIVNGKTRTFDPLHHNDFWWNK